MRLLAVILLAVNLWLLPQLAVARLMEMAPTAGTITALDVCLDRCLDQHYYKAQRIYDAHSADAPAILLPAFALGGERLAFRVCADADQNIHYFLREMKPANPYGACIILEKEVFPGPAEHAFTFLSDNTRLDGWSIQVPPAWQAKYYSQDSAMTPVTFAQVKDGACPPSGDPGYFHADNISPGLLKEFLRTFKAATASKAAFNKALANNAAKIRVPNIASELRGASINSVRCSLDGCAATFRNNALYVSFDVKETGVVITDAGMIVW